MLTQHHILWDGWSTPLIVTELLDRYTALVAGDRTPAGLEAPLPAFRSYLEWLGRQDRDRALAAWRQALSGLTAPTLLAGADPHRMQTLPQRLSVELPAGTTARLTEVTRAHGLTLSAVVQGAWAILLGRSTGSDDVVFGQVVSGRTPELEGVENMVGLFINTLPVRFRLRSEETLTAALGRFQAEQAVLMDHQHVSLSDVQEAAGLGTLFDTVVAFENYPLDEARLRGGDGDGPRITGARATDATHYSVNLVVHPGPRLRFDLDHRPEVLDREAAGRLADALRDLLTAVAEEPSSLVGSTGSAEVSAPSGAPRPRNGDDAPFEPPATETEELIAAVWADVLEVSEVGRRSNFFLSGGQSLKAMRVAARLREALNLELPLRLVFEHPTVAQLAVAVEAALAEEAIAAAAAPAGAHTTLGDLQ